jgi:2-methylaconitate cis-trans-isomerase PrpF
MDKTAVVQTLVMSEKNRSVVRIKIVNTDKPIIGAVQKVLNQVIILKPFTSQPITLTFSDIESVYGAADSFLLKILQNLLKTLHKGFSR